MWRRWTMLAAICAVILGELASCTGGSGAGGPEVTPGFMGGKPSYDESFCQGPVHWC